MSAAAGLSGTGLYELVSLWIVTTDTLFRISESSNLTFLESITEYLEGIQHLYPFVCSLYPSKMLVYDLALSFVRAFSFSRMKALQPKTLTWHRLGTLFVKHSNGMIPLFAVIGSLLVMKVAVFNASIYRNFGEFASCCMLLVFSNRVRFICLVIPLYSRVSALVNCLKMPLSSHNLMNSKLVNSPP
jgi:hypothetical protein